VKLDLFLDDENRRKSFFFDVVVFCSVLFCSVAVAVDVEVDADHSDVNWYYILETFESHHQKNI